ncbi:efflux RND transporter periplasmic adaptor subunit [Azorhizobium sp. AG788]|uniref:efflux RND transporter periplasmic adaptor subunit n=1 Tax=Azorhizobium sp. AG788 TaxID=2183897 RepID=UPI0031388FB6
MFRSVGGAPLLVLALVAPFLLAGCGKEKEPVASDPRPVRTVAATPRPAGDAISLTGHVEAQNEATYGFRVGGRIIERLVNVGDVIKPGQVLARLDPQNELNALRSAEAGVSSAEAQLSQARNAYERQRTLLDRGFTPRAQFEVAEQAFRTARARMDDAQAQLKTAQDRLGFTELKADAGGTVTARRAEPGEVVQPGQAVLQVARSNGRDAVFDVPASVLRTMPGDPEIIVSLTDDAGVTAMGRVREVAPQADPVTRTFQVRVGLIDAPEAMRLGSTVTGRVKLDTGPVIEIPASALTRVKDQPAVWIVDPATKTVSLRNIEVLRFTPAAVTVADGLKPADIVVTAGVQALHPGQKVRLLGAAL